MCPTLQPQGLYSPWNSPGKNIGVDSHSFLQGIFRPPGYQTPVSCTVGRFFTIWDTREAHEKQYGDSLKNYHMTQQSHYWAYTLKNHNSKRHMHPNVHYSTIYNSQDIEATLTTMNRWIANTVVVHIHNVILLNGIWVISSKVDEPTACYTEWSKSEREKKKQNKYINAYMWNLEKMLLMNLFARQA